MIKLFIALKKVQPDRRYLARKILNLRKFLFFTVLVLTLGACSKSQPISSGPYHAIKCVFKSRFVEPYTFVFHQENGSLYFFDSLTDKFRPLTQKVQDGVYFNSMEEYFSRIDGNNLVISKIDYLQKLPTKQLIIKITINLKSLVMTSVYEDPESNQFRSKGNCVWINPKLS